MIASSQRTIDDYKSKQMSKNRSRELENQRLLDEAMIKKVFYVVFNKREVVFYQSTKVVL
jgi:hypothetical protein